MKCLLCENGSEAVKDGIVFFRIPINRKTRKLWLESLNLPNFTPDSIVCSEHFQPEDFRYQPNGNIFLEKFAIPTISNKNEVRISTKILTSPASENVSERPAVFPIDTRPSIEFVSTNDEPAPMPVPTNDEPEPDTKIKTKEEITKPVDTAPKKQKTQSGPTRMISTILGHRIDNDAPKNVSMMLKEPPRMISTILGHRIENDVPINVSMMLKEPPEASNSDQVTPIAKKQTNFKQLSSYVSNIPIFYVQAESSGSETNGFVPKDVKSQFTQTSVDDLQLPVPKQLLQNVPDKSDIGRYIPVTVLLQKEIRAETRELTLAKSTIESLRCRITKKDVQLKGLRQTVRRYSARLQCLNEIVKDLRSPLNCSVIATIIDEDWSSDEANPLPANRRGKIVSKITPRRRLAVQNVTNKSPANMAIEEIDADDFVGSSVD